MRRGLINYQQFEPNFVEVSKRILHEPVQERRCTDPACLVFFLLIVTAYFVLGGLGISEFNAVVPQINTNTNTNTNVQNQTVFAKNWSTIVLGISIGIIIAYLYVLMIKLFPKAMVYFMIFLTLSVFAGLGIMGLILNINGLAISMLITFLLYVLLLLCLRRKIQVGIALVTVATRFISEKPIIFVTPIFKVILTFFVIAFGAVSISCLAITGNYKQYTLYTDSSKQQIFIGFIVICLIPMTFVFYYMMTYVIGVIGAYWYYGIQGQKAGLCKAYGFMFKQLGSLAFAGILLSVVKIGAAFAQSNYKTSRNAGAAICMCMVTFCLRAIQGILQVLNSYSVIVMSVTGEPYIETAKSTMGLLWRQIRLLYATNLITNFLIIWGITITVGVPCIVASVMMKSQNPSDLGTVVWTVAICSLLISMMIFQILVEGVSCIFVYYVMDKTFVLRGLIKKARIALVNVEMIDMCAKNPYLTDNSEQDSERQQKQMNAM